MSGGYREPWYSELLAAPGVLYSRRPAEAMAYVVLPGPGMIG
jgi:hypothetical protein